MSMANSSATWPASRACDAPPGDDGLLATQMTATAEPLRLLVHRQNLRDTCSAADPDAQRCEPALGAVGVHVVEAREHRGRGTAGAGGVVRLARRGAEKQVQWARSDPAEAPRPLWTDSASG